MNWLKDLFQLYRAKQELVDIYGVILYTDAHAYVKKVLVDEDYWKSLDDISGTRWAIFSIKPRQGSYELPDVPPDTFGFMVPVWKEPAENKPIIEEFEIKSTKGLPTFICFTQDSDGEILKVTLKIDNSTVEAAYNSLKRNIEIVTEAVEGILKENTRNPLGAYSAVYFATESFKDWERIKKGIKFWEWTKNLFP